MVTEPAVFVGTLRHRRHAPTNHVFDYPVFMVYLDAARLPELMRVSRFTGYNRFNWASFHEGDHLGDPRRPLIERLQASAAEAGVRLPRGPIFLLTHLRYLGYCFNPVSFFYAFDEQGKLGVVAAEVHNTFGESHTYWLTGDTTTTTFRAAADKQLRVSPFLPQQMHYRFALTAPAERTVIHIEAFEGDALRLDATLSLERRPWSALEIRRQLVRHPAMTAEVIAGIHWQALRLWWKGARAQYTERST